MFYIVDLNSIHIYVWFILWTLIPYTYNVNEGDSISYKNKKDIYMDLRQLLSNDRMIGMFGVITMISIIIQRLVYYNKCKSLKLCQM